MFILKYGTILDAPRAIICRISLINELFKCSLCLGFWSGVIIFAATRDDVLLPLASAGICWITDNINNAIQSLEIKIDKELEDD